jgi:hypothetical protein
MPDIIGEPLEDYVIKQINVRQKLHGSLNRTPIELLLLNSNTSWLKLASAISVSEERLKDINLTDSSGLKGYNLAKSYILSSGISKLENGELKQRQGFIPEDTGYSGTYTYGQYGYSPMPGLISADIKTLNRGSIKKATVKLVAHNTEQFHIIDLLYLRLGYTVLLEWGNSTYAKNDTDPIEKGIIRNTVLEDSFYKENDFRKVLKLIEDERELHDGNYDGFLAKVSNFSWNFKEDGSYDIELTLISLGDVIESLKTNISPSSGLTKFIKGTQITINTAPSTPSSTDEATGDSSPVENNKSTSIIHSMLYIWKYIDTINHLQSNISPPTPGNITFEGVTKGYFLSNQIGSTPSSKLSIATKSYDVMLMQMTLVLFDSPKNTNFINNFANIIDLSKKNIASIKYGPFNFDQYMYQYQVSNNLTKQTIDTPGIYYNIKSQKWFGWFGWAKMKYIPDAFSLPETDNTSANRVKIFDYLIYDWSEKEFKGNVGNLKNADGNSTYPEEDIRHLYFPKDYFNKDKTNGVPLSTPLPIDDSLTKTNNIELNFPILNTNNAYINTAIFEPKVNSFKLDPKDGFQNVVAILPNNTPFPLKPYTINTWKEGGNVVSTKYEYPQFQTSDGNDGIDAEVKYIFNDSQLGLKPSSYFEPFAYTGTPDGVYIKESISQIGTVTIDNPIVDAGPYDAFTLNLKVPQFYLRLNYLLKYIKQNVLPRVKLSTQHDDNPQIFDIQIDENNITNIMFAIPDSQISFDPKVCIVRNETFLNNKKVAPELNTWAANDDPYWDANLAEKGFSARTMNIYLNFDFIIESLSEDQYGDVNIYDFLNNLCIGINKALGGVNNLEPVIDETTNIVRLLDTTPIPGTVRNKSSKHNDYKIHLYGYGKKNNSSISNFIRNLSLKTAITPEFATMVTVGATAGGYTKGVEATAFSKWNNGLVDKYKTEFTPGNKETAESAVSSSNSSSKDEAITNWETRFVNPPTSQEVNRYGFGTFTEEDATVTPTSPGEELKEDIINGNISVANEYLKYYMAKETGTGGGGVIGFIPFKMSLTMDGLSGIKIYNKLTVDTSFLPAAYKDQLDLIVTGVSHKISKQDWVTDIETTVIPNSDLKKSSRTFTPTNILNNTPQSPSGGTPPRSSRRSNSETQRAKAKYGLPPQEGGKPPLVKFSTPFPLFYKGEIVKDLQNCTNLTNSKKEKKKLSSLTWDHSTKKWTDPSTGIKYTSPLDNKIRQFRVHQLEKNSIETAYIQILAAYGIEKIYELGLNCCSGTTNVRDARGGSSYSMHSWSIAIDILAVLNPNTTTPSAPFRKPIYKNFLDIMEANGWYSGGRAWNRDYMHFQTIKP